MARLNSPNAPSTVFVWNVTAHVFFGGMDDRLVQSFVAGIVSNP